VAARKRFHANDNIAEFIEPGELESAARRGRGQDAGRAGQPWSSTRPATTTPATRPAAWPRCTSTRCSAAATCKPPAITEFPNAEHLNELMIVGPITVRSACSHHFCPVIGKLWIGVMPNEHTNVIGLSKYARLAEWIMGRPQIQEEAVVQLADLIMEKTQPDGLAIVMEASHYCMAWRGVKDMDSKMINSVMRGVFLKDSEPAPRIPGPDSAEGLSMLVRLLYCSRAVDTSPEAIESILSQSRQHNPTSGITGILCYGGGIFLQASKAGACR
jgi:GTP cyclohydrolase I